MSTGSDFWGGDGGVKEERPGGVRETGYRKSLWAAVTIPCLFLTIFPPSPRSLPGAAGGRLECLVTVRAEDKFVLT